jgi:hypothetical protein
VDPYLEMVMMVGGPGRELRSPVNEVVISCSMSSLDVT